MGILAKMLSPALAILLGLISVVHGNVFTVDMAPLTVQRLDPIVFNDISPEGHVHSIFGASGFSRTGTYDELINSKCTTGNIKKDLSNYWVPSLYVEKPNGEVHYVEMYMAVYYKLINDCCQTTPPGGPNPIVPGSIHAFPPGFKMLAGGPMADGPWEGGASVNHKCMGAWIDTPAFPDRPELCTEGLRAEVSFPSCWDGVNLDSPTHNSHVSYREPGSWEGGPCPASHPFMMPTVFFEAIYRIQDVYQPGDKLVYSMRDYTGYGFHGDFLMGWEDGIMDQLIDYCTYTEDQEYFCNAENIAGRYGGPDYSCHWDGQGNGDYTGVLNGLPPCGSGCRPPFKNQANETFSG